MDKATLADTLLGLPPLSAAVCPNGRSKERTGDHLGTEMAADLNLTACVLFTPIRMERL